MATAKKKIAPTAAKRAKPAAKAAPTTPRAPAKAPSTPSPRAAAPVPAAANSAKADKAKKPKLVRDSFTIPKNEYAVLDELKQRAAKTGAPAKKSEILRAGIKALAAMGDAAFAAALRAVPAVKTGRPAKS